MTLKGQVWKCDICGNVVEVLHNGSDSLVCCGKPMRLLIENSVDADKEKHVPVIEGKKVKIGTIPHPMEEKHYIEWIEATSKTGQVAKVYLLPGQKPEATFDFEVVRARAYCNLHGLWKA